MNKNRKPWLRCETPWLQGPFNRKRNKTPFPRVNNDDKSEKKERWKSNAWFGTIPPRWVIYSLYITAAHYLIVLSKRIDDIVLHVLILIWLLQDKLKNQNPHLSLMFIRIIFNFFLSMAQVNERCLYYRNISSPNFIWNVHEKSVDSVDIYF